MSRDVDVVIIGAGVVGLACAAVLSRQGLSVIVIERHAREGQETSSRNSGVIHAGLYYPVGSLKALCCVEGRRLLYARCQRHGVPFKRTRKLLVGSGAAELEKLEAIQARGRENGAGELRLIERAELQRLEPRVKAEVALLSPETGIVDVHGLMESYRVDAKAHGALFSFNTVVFGVERSGELWTLHTRGPDGEGYALTSRFVVNAAGLEAPAIASLAGLDIDALGYRYRLCKGDYFALAPWLRGAISHLVYPVPVHAGLGIHLTMDLGGGLIAGPDTEYVDAASYVVDPAKAAHFAEAVRRYLPEVRDDDFTAGYAGIRPKLQGPGDPVRDFVVCDEVDNGAPGFVNLIGIESPGLTSSEAIAVRVGRMLAMYGQ